MNKILNTVTKELQKNSTFLSTITIVSLFVVFINARNSPEFFKSSSFRLLAVFFTALVLQIDSYLGAVIGLVLFTAIAYGEIRKNELFENVSAETDNLDSHGCVIGKQVFSTLHNKCVGDITKGASYDDLKENNSMETVVIPEYSYTVEKPSRGITFDSTKDYLAQSDIINKEMRDVNQRAVDSEMEDSNMDNVINRSEFNAFRTDSNFKNLNEAGKERIFRLFDTNTDNLIDEEELTTRRARMFMSNVDTNVDGVISPQELGRPSQQAPVEQTEEILTVQNETSQPEETIPDEFEGFSSSSYQPQYSFL